MELRLINDGILVKQTGAEETTDGGIVVPETLQKKPKEGKVVAVGPGNFDAHSGMVIVMQVKVGDHVFYKSFAGTELTIDGEKFIVLEESDVLIVKE